MSDAALLRQAAFELRLDAGRMHGSDHDFLHAVANWLSGCALALDVSPAATKAHAVAVARAYLGDAA